MSGTRIIDNPTGAFGYNAVEGLNRQEAEFVAGAVIAGCPQVVSIGTDGKVSESATNGTAALQIGIAVDNAVVGKITSVVVQGIVRNVPVDGAVAAGGILKRSTTTTGSLTATATPAAGEAIAIALAASASNVCDVWVCKAV